MPNMLIMKATDEVDGAEYVATAIARSRDGTEVARAELRVPKIAIDPDLVGHGDVSALKDALEVAVLTMAKANARAAGH